MEIEEAKDILANCIADYVIGDYCVGKYCPMEDECKDKDCPFQIAIDTVLNELEKKDKVIDLLADDLRYYEGMQQDQLFCIDTCEGKMCDEEHCKERIKEYFYKKVE